MVNESQVFGKSKPKRIKIINKLVEVNKPYPIQYILKHLKEEYTPGNFRNLHEWHLSKMKIILNGPVSVDIGEGNTLKGYSLKNDIPTLAFLIDSVYNNENVSSLMASEYYKNMIPIIITELKNKTNYKFKEHEEDFLKLSLELSPTVLKFVLSADCAKNLTHYREHTPFKNFNIDITETITNIQNDALLDTLENTKKITDKGDFHLRVMSCTSQKIQELHKKLNYISGNYYMPFMFYDFFKVDCLNGLITTVDYMKLTAILMKIEKMAW